MQSPFLSVSAYVSGILLLTSVVAAGPSEGAAVSQGADASAASVAGLIFESPQSLGLPVNTGNWERSPELSSDGKTLYFGFSTPGAQYDIKMAQRESVGSPFGSPIFVTSVTTAASEYLPSISSDGMELYFARWSSAWDLFVSTRDSIGDEFGVPVRLGSEFNTGGRELAPHISADGLTLYYTKEQTSGNYATSRIVASTRVTVNDPWSASVLEAGGINDAFVQKASIARDGLVAFFASDRTGSLGADDLWVSTRETPADPWSAPVHLGATVNSTAEESSPFYSAKEHAIYFSSYRTNNHDLYVTRITNDCNANWIADDCDIDCGVGGGACDLPGCGLSLDGDGNGVPDECEGLGLEFEPAQPLGSNVNTALRERGPELSDDGLIMVFNSSSGGGQTDIVMATRSTIDSPFGPPISIPSVNTGGSEAMATLSSDSLDLYFGRCCANAWDIYVTSRGSTGEAFGAPVNLGAAINDSGRNMSPHITTDGLKLYYTSEQTPGNFATTRWMYSTRSAIGAPWAPGILETGPINDATVMKGTVDPSDLVALIGTDRSGGHGGWDSWIATRAATSDPWSAPVNLGAAINTASADEYPFYSPADHSVYFSSNRPGGQDYDLYVSRISNDCNRNFIADECDLDCGPMGGLCDVPGCGFSEDCQGNGILDECDIADGTEDDCNDNGVPDECDLTAGSSLDDNGNGIPDECFAAEGIPTVSSWGMLTMMLLLIVSGTIAIARRKELAPI